MDMSVYFDRQHLVQHSYATTEDFKVRSDAWESLASRSISEWYVDQLKDLKFSNVLDAGCGLGRFSYALARSRPLDVTAIDIADAMVEAARERIDPVPGKHRFLQTSIEDAPFDDGSFDLILANLVLFHVPDIKGAFDKLARLLKSGGHIALLTPDFDWMSELNRFQDHALLKLGFAHDHAALTAPGTNRFCDANILLHAPSTLELIRKPWFDGTMDFPDIDALLNFYTHTMRYRNVALRLGDDSLHDAVRDVVEAHLARTGSLKVSSSLYLYVFRKH
jgi:2-polyprenyl-3-methyl-5-hydroxy-6-metoxy-1,4-benzoquinol methylase